MNPIEQALTAVIIFVCGVFLGVSIASKSNSDSSVDKIARYETCIKGGGLEQRDNCVRVIFQEKI